MDLQNNLYMRAALALQDLVAFLEGQARLPTRCRAELGGRLAYARAVLMEVRGETAPVALTDDSV